MALFHTTVVDNQIKALPTVDTASGAIATFDTDLTENLVEVKCQIVATQSGSGTPSPSNPRPITTYTSLNLSHSGADTSNPNVTNIPFGQTVANGVLDITTGKLRVTHKKYDLTNLLNYVVSGQTDTTVTAQHTVLLGSYATTTIISNRFSRSIPSGVGRMVYGSPNLYLVLPKDELQSIDQSGIRDWFNNHESYVVYQLETPIEIQLDSITLQALLNENNIWCDTGDTEVKYLLTVGKKIS